MVNNKTIRLIVNEANLRLDKYIAQTCPELTRSYIQKLIQEGLVSINDCLGKASQKPKIGEEIIIEIPPVPPSVLLPEKIPLNIIYEDNEIIVIDKPAGITVHPAPGHPSHTLINAILSHCPELVDIDSSQRPGIVHRLDKDTSGLMVVAKSKSAQLNLAAQMKNRSILKKYMVLVRFRLVPEEGTIDAPIGRHPVNRKKMAVVNRGREARTSYRVLRYLNDYTLVEATLVTGRTHQIRVHFSSIGHPVIGDQVYGHKVSFLERQFLHAYLLGFTLPGTGQYKEFRAKMPMDLQQAIGWLEDSSRRL
jgi:23S rRNA pseudouridine1911/1915/1917 synthase